MFVPMEHDCLAPASLPHITRLYSDFLSWRTNRASASKLGGLYPHRPDTSGIKAAVRGVTRGTAAYRNEMRSAVTNILLDQNASFAGGQLSPEVARNLDRLAAKAVAFPDIPSRRDSRLRPSGTEISAGKADAPPIALVRARVPDTAICP